MEFNTIVENRLEWEAWQRVVKELNNKGIDINNEAALTSVLKAWGERYHELRRVFANRFT